MTLIDICKLQDISLDTAKKSLASLQQKGLITGYLPDNPYAEIKATDAGKASEILIQ